MTMKIYHYRFDKVHEIIRTAFPNHLVFGKNYMDLNYNVNLAELLCEGNRSWDVIRVV